jgi:hypothetical protein
MTSSVEKVNKLRQYICITDLSRIKLVLLITEEKLTCFAAAKKLSIPYTNAKVIYRIFRSEGRITAKSKFFRGRDQNYRFE